MSEQTMRWNEVGKRMPYRLPEDFFAQNEAELMRRVEQPRGRLMRLPIWLGGAVAAAVLVGVMLWLPMREMKPMATEQLYAYNETMSNEELAGWVEFYEADLFVSYE
ncbi:MAG: hypothetical protein IJ028_04420 [Alistipes sp.]|nr:hypothetical protein [Alistipes sp.]MBQ8916411.1 hypothetical protein [Alistipes sp.]